MEYGQWHQLSHYSDSSSWHLLLKFRLFSCPVNHCVLWFKVCRIDELRSNRFCEARRASHCHSPQTTFSSNSTCCVLSTQKSAMHVVVYADRLTTQHSIVDIVHWSWSYWQFCYPRWHVECFWAALAAHWISSASHTSVLPQHPRRKIVPYRVGWNHHTSDYYG